jgi:hypothetical protein
LWSNEIRRDRAGRATLFPEKLAAFPDLVEIAKTSPACCRVSETTSLSTPVGLAISGWRLKSLAAALWWLLVRLLDLGQSWGRAEPGRSRGGSAAEDDPTKGEVARHRPYVPDTLPAGITRNRRGGQ